MSAYCAVQIEACALGLSAIRRKCETVHTKRVSKNLGTDRISGYVRAKMMSAKMMSRVS